MRTPRPEPPKSKCRSQRTFLLHLRQLVPQFAESGAAACEPYRASIGRHGDARGAAAAFVGGKAGIIVQPDEFELG